MNRDWLDEDSEELEREATGAPAGEDVIFEALEVAQDARDAQAAYAREAETPVRIIDVSVENHGSIILVRPLTPEAEAWIDQNVPETASWFGGALACEPRYVPTLIEGMRQDGLLV